MKLSIITATHHRPNILQANALPSIMAQTIEPSQLEWIVVNDGRNFEISQLIETLQSEFEVVHHPIAHPKTGFGLCHAHYKDHAPVWNPAYRIFCDYDYFLRCMGQWSRSAFALNAEILVSYVQSPNGIIGQSRYRDWATEYWPFVMTKPCLRRLRPIQDTCIRWPSAGSTRAIAPSLHLPWISDRSMSLFCLGEETIHALAPSIYTPPIYFLLY